MSKDLNFSNSFICGLSFFGLSFFMNENINKENTNKNEKKSYTDPVTGKFCEGNPGGGRPKGVKNFTSKVREALEKIADGKGDTTNEQLLIKSILKKGIEDEDTSTQRLIWNYLDGMPPQTIEHEGEFKVDVSVDKMINKVYDESS